MTTYFTQATKTYTPYEHLTNPTYTSYNRSMYLSETISSVSTLKTQA